MNNQYKQKLSDENQIKYRSLKAVGIMCFVLAAMMLLFSAYTAGLIMAVAGGCAIYFRKYLLVSFEYEINGGQVNVDKVIADTKRKNMVSFNVKDIVIMAPEASKKLKETDIHPSKTLNLYPKTYLKGIYTIILNSEGKVLKVKIIPDKTFIDICEKSIKQKVIKE